MARLVWTQESRWWLREIYGFIARDSQEAAGRVVRGIYDKAHLLVEFPEMGYSYRRRADRRVRVLLYGRYRIVYEHSQDGDIYVLGVFHGALDLKRHLRLR